jgi:hypothetical protein
MKKYAGVHSGLGAADKLANKLYPSMANRSMAQKLATDEAIDISDCARKGGYYILTEFVEDKEYVDAKRESWIGSIGKDRQTGEILASVGACFYLNPSYDCLYLR